MAVHILHIVVTYKPHTLINTTYMRSFVSMTHVLLFEQKMALENTRDEVRQGLVYDVFTQ